MEWGGGGGVVASRLQGGEFGTMGVVNNVEEGGETFAEFDVVVSGDKGCHRIAFPKEGVYWVRGGDRPALGLI